MAKKSQIYSETLAGVKIWYAKTFPNAFDAAPVVLLDATTEKKKSGVRSVTSTGCDMSSEVTGLTVLVTDYGYDAGGGSHPARDAGKNQITASKVYQTISFNSTFAAAPIVVTSYEGSTVGGKKTSVYNITTTGCQLANEVANDYTHWFAMPGAAYGF